MTAVGYTASGLVTTDDIGEIGGPAGPLDGDGLIPEAQLPAGAGGDSPDPATTVVAQTSPGASSAVGISTAYARQDHAHGTPPLLTPGDIGAATAAHTHGYVPTARQVLAGTGLTGGGDLTADRTLTVAYGSSSTTAARGDDSRLSNARTPVAHAASHATGGSDPVTPAAIGAMPAPTYSTPLAGTWTNATTTLNDVTGLALAIPAAGTYEFAFWATWSGDQGGGTSTATAPRWQLTGPTSSHLEYVVEIQTANATTNRFRRNALATPASPTTGAQTVANPYMTEIRGRIVATAAGTLQPQASLATGTFTGTVSVLAGSYGRLQQVA